MARLVAVDVVADQGEHGGGQDQDRPGPSGALAGIVSWPCWRPRAPRGAGGAAPRRSPAPARRAVSPLRGATRRRRRRPCGRPRGACWCTAPRRSERRLAGQPVGDQGEEPLAERRGVEGGDELLADGVLGLVQPLAHHPVAGDEVGRLSWGSPSRWTESSRLASSCLGRTSGPSTPSRIKGSNALPDPPAEVVVPLGGVAGLADVVEEGRRELPLGPEGLGDGVEGRGLGDGVDQVGRAARPGRGSAPGR